jgi:hypothetical protein
MKVSVNMFGSKAPASLESYTDGYAVTVKAELFATVEAESLFNVCL